MSSATIDPATGETVREFDALDDARIEAALAASHETLRRLRGTAIGDRAGWLRQAAELLRDEKHELGRTMNNGQSCIAAKRSIVHEAVHDEFRDRFAAALDALTAGPPMEAGTDVGPLATESLRGDLDEQVERSLAQGARRVTGAAAIDGPGWYYRPGLIEDIPESAPAFGEELFGPVAVLFRVPDLDAAIDLGNATRFGLGSAIFTEDEAEMARAFDELDAGATFVNTITASDPRLPFGGTKSSGVGRELAAEGLREFLNLKTCAVGATSGEAGRRERPMQADFLDHVRDTLDGIEAFAEAGKATGVL